MSQHQGNEGHEGRLVYLEQTLADILTLLGDLKTQISVQGTQILSILDRFKELETPGESSMCVVHRMALEDFKRELAVTKLEIETLKTKVWQWSGGIALAAFLVSFFGSHFTSNREVSRLDKVEQMQNSILNQLKDINVP